MGRNLNEYVYPYKKISIGSLVEVQIIKRRIDVAIVIDRNVGTKEKDHWYIVRSIYTDKEYAAYPNELKVLSGEVED